MTTQSAKTDSNRIVEFADDLNGAIRENPVAAGLVGIGVLWMFFGDAKISAFGSMVPSATSTVTAALGRAAEAAENAVSHAVVGATASVNEGARHVAGAISSGAESVASTIREGSSAGYNALIASEARGDRPSMTKDAGPSPSELGRQIGMTVQQNLAKTLEAQPLLLGAIGIAVGAGIASAFPPTKLEQEMIGDAGSEMKEKIYSIANETSARAKDVLSEVKKEAAVQGVTSASAVESLQAVVQKAKTVAATSRENIKDRLS